MNNPLISFNAEAENGGSHQAADPAKMRYERMCNEAQDQKKTTKNKYAGQQNVLT